MFDTIATTLNPKEFNILNWSKFKKTQYRGRYSYDKYVLNFDYKEFGYMPRLTYYDRTYNQTLRIEFSAPKLIHGNNFDEITDNEFNLLVDTLQKKIISSGFVSFSTQLKKAQVSAIHYSKNIILTDGTTSSSIIRELNRQQLFARYDCSLKDFRDGHAIQYHTNYCEIVAYDKVKDLLQSKISEKRSIEKDNIIQLDLFNNCLPLSQPFEVLRLEVRLTRSKLKQLKKKLGFDEELIISELCTEKMSRLMLNYFWSEIIKKIILTQKYDSTTALYQTLRRNNPDLKISNLLKLIPIIEMSKEVGFRELKSLIKASSNDKYAQRLFSDLKNLKMDKNVQYLPFNAISDSLKEFKPVRLEDYQISFDNVKNSKVSYIYED